jgi:hypothetical protein
MYRPSNNCLTRASESEAIRGESSAESACPPTLLKSEGNWMQTRYKAYQRSVVVENRRLHSEPVVGVVRDFATVIRPRVGLLGHSCARRNRFVKTLALDVN